MSSDTFIHLADKLRAKAIFLKRKFKPAQTSAKPNKMRQEKKKKSRDRYKLRRFKKYFTNGGKNSVINISSTAITPDQTMLLSLGSGFIPTPTNSSKEEELHLRTESGEVVSPTNGRSYFVNKSLNCTDRGIYSIVCACTSLYTGKTTTSFAQRFREHFSSASSVFDHSESCTMGSSMGDFRIQFLENMYSRGKYSLSEREYLWNERLRGVLNIQKTLKK